MDPLTIGLIGGGASLLGNMFGANASSQNVAATNATNMQIANQQMAFQERMSNTAYQRSSADMQKAGLNPMMMFGSGGPASSPGGSAIAAQANPAAGETGKAIGNAVQHGITTMATAKTVDKMTDEMANLKEQNALLKKQQEQTAASTGLTRQQTRTEVEETGRRAAERKLANLGIPIKGLSAIEADAILDLPDAVVRRAAQAVYATGKVGTVIGDVSGSAKSIMSLITGLRSGKRGLSASETRDLYNKFEAMRGGQ